MLMTLELPAELANENRSAWVAVYDRLKVKLAAASFVVHGAGRYHVLMVRTGKDGLAQQYQTFLEGAGLSGYKPTNNALYVCDGVAITIHNLEVTHS